MNSQLLLLLINVFQDTVSSQQVTSDVVTGYLPGCVVALHKDPVLVLASPAAVGKVDLMIKAEKCTHRTISLSFFISGFLSWNTFGLQVFGRGDYVLGHEAVCRCFWLFLPFQQSYFTQGLQKVTEADLTTDPEDTSVDLTHQNMDLKSDGNNRCNRQQTGKCLPSHSACWNDISILYHHLVYIVVNMNIFGFWFDKTWHLKTSRCTLGTSFQFPDIS